MSPLSENVLCATYEESQVRLPVIHHLRDNLETELDQDMQGSMTRNLTCRSTDVEGLRPAFMLFQAALKLG